MIHIQLYKYTCGNIVNTIMTNETQFFRKIYLSLYSKGLRKGYVWEVSRRLNKDCNILTPSSSVPSSTSLLFRWAAQPEAMRAQLSAGSGSHCLELQQLTPNSKLTRSSCCTGLYNYIIICGTPAWVSVASAPNSPDHSQGYTLISSTGYTCSLIDGWVNMLHAFNCV